MNGILSRCLSRCWRIHASGGKLDEDTVDCVAVLTCRLIPQSPKKCSLLLTKAFPAVGFVMAVIPFHHPALTAEPGAYSFNQVRAHEYRNIPADCSRRDVKLVHQIAVCIVPSQAQ